MVKTILIGLSFLISLNSLATPNVAEKNEYWNKQINSITEVEKESIWQTPAQTVTTKKGTLVDIVVVKYFDLIAIGVPKEALTVA